MARIDERASIIRKKRRDASWSIGNKIYAISMGARSPVVFTEEQIAGKSTRYTRRGSFVNI